MPFKRVFIYRDGTKMTELTNEFKIRLIPMASLVTGQAADVRGSQVTFDVTPTFSESRSTEYTPVTPVHMPGAVQMYKHTNSRNFEIGAVLISRNIEDAIKNMSDLQKLRGWMMPYFGTTSTVSSNQQNNRNAVQANNNTMGPTQFIDPSLTQADRVLNEGVQLRGAPPDVLYLYAYSTATNDERSGGPQRVNINRVPVVMTNLSITYPDDVDYIPVYNASGGGPTKAAEPFPRKLTVSISLVETHSPREYERFDLLKFKQGKLTNF